MKVEVLQRQFQKEKRSYPEENANRKVVDYKINEDQLLKVTDENQLLP